MKKAGNSLLPYVFVESLFSEKEIEQINSVTMKYDTWKGRVGIEENASVKESVRISDVRYFFRHDHTIKETKWIFDKLDDIVRKINQSYYAYDLYDVSAFQYTTYNAKDNGKFDWHIDSVLYKDYNTVQTRKLSISVFLNDSTEYEGGTFELSISNQNNPNKFRGKAGDGLFFPSFFSHRITPLTKGIRKSLVVWVEGPRWK